MSKAIDFIRSYLNRDCFGIGNYGDTAVRRINYSIFSKNLYLIFFMKHFYFKTNPEKFTFLTIK